MDPINKFLSKLTPKERELLKKILEDIRRLEIKNHDIKALKGLKGVFRLRKGRIRIIFTKGEGIGIPLKINFRKDAYRD